MDDKLGVTLRGTRLKIKTPRLRSRTLDKKNKLHESVPHSPSFVDKSGDSACNNEKKKNDVSANRVSRSKLLEKFTNCLCIQVESADQGGQMEADKTDSEMLLPNAPRIMQQDLQCDDQALSQQFDNSRFSLNLRSNFASNETPCDGIDEPVADWNAQMQPNISNGGLTKRTLMGQKLNSDILTGDQFGSTNYSPLTTKACEQPSAYSEWREDNTKTDTIRNVANEVILASNLLADALATLRRCMPPSSDQTPCSETHPQIEYQTTRQVRNLHLPKTYRIGLVESVLDDMTQVEPIPDLSNPPKDLILQQVPIDEKIVIQAQTKVLICIEDLDPIERIGSDRSVSPTKDLRNPVYPHNSHLSPRPEEWIEDSSHKLSCPSPARLPLKKNVCTSIALGYDSLDMTTRFSSVPTVITNTFRPISTEGTQLTEMDDLLSTDESEGAQPFLEHEYDLQKEMPAKKHHINWPPVGRVHSMKRQKNKPFVRALMMAGDSNESQCTKSDLFTSAGGDFGPVHEFLLSWNATDHDSSLAHSQRNATQNRNVQLQSIKVGIHELHDLNECSYDVVKQRNNHNEKTMETTLPDQAQISPVLNCDKEEDIPSGEKGPHESADVADEEAFSVGIQTTSERPIINNGTTAPRVDHVGQLNPSGNCHTNNDLIVMNLSQVSGYESDPHQSMQTGQVQTRFESEVHLTSASQLMAPSNDHTHQNLLQTRGGGDNTRQRRRNQGLGVWRNAVRCSRRGLYRQTFGGQSRNTAPASMLANQHADRMAFDETRNLGDDVYDSILEQIHILFAPNEDELGSAHLWRTHVHVPGPQSGDVSVQLDHEQITDTIGTFARRAQSTVEIRTPSYVNDPSTDS